MTRRSRRALLIAAVGLAVIVVSKRTPTPQSVPAGEPHTLPPPSAEAAAIADPQPVVLDAAPVPPPVLLESVTRLSADLPAERQIAAITQRAGMPEWLKARTLLQMLPGLPAEAQAQAAEEATARLPDADYEAVLLPVIRNPATHGAAMSVLFADLLERPDAIALPTLLHIARHPTHPYAATARDDLALLLRADHGDDWPRWEAEIRRQIAQSAK